MVLSKHKLVREVGFEPTTSCSQSKRATGLRYTLTGQVFYPIFATLWSLYGRSELIGWSVPEVTPHLEDGVLHKHEQPVW